MAADWPNRTTSPRFSCNGGGETRGHSNGWFPWSTKNFAGSRVDKWPASARVTRCSPRRL